MNTHILRDIRSLLRNTCFSALLLLILATAAGCSPTPPLPSPSVPPSNDSSPLINGSDSGTRGEHQLQVHYIDVGQGDCGLIESDGHYMLIDAGERDQADTVIRYLTDAGVTRLDYVIGTHPHSDHIGGLADVLKAFDIGKVILAPKEHTTGTFERLLDTMAEKGLTITKPVVGTAYELGGASFTILAPNADYGDDRNNWSVGIRLDYGSTSFVFTGDAEASAEADICNNGISLKANVLKLGHHGSSTSNSREFLERISPEYGVISCGQDNSYGHPHKEVLQLLQELGIQVLRTDQLGTIVAASDGETISWQTDLPDSEPSPDSYVLNTNTKKIHRPSCPSVNQILEENRDTYTGNSETLLQQGYSPCKSCNP